jgi:hypothetical protein
LFVEERTVEESLDARMGRLLLGRKADAEALERFLQFVSILDDVEAGYEDEDERAERFAEAAALGVDPEELEDVDWKARLEAAWYLLADYARHQGPAFYEIVRRTGRLKHGG